tara:strand:- start:253 stop:966 length:714 start_codon:yes stop_codon:yes gene_type:complete
MRVTRVFLPFAVSTVLLAGLAGCDTVPKESVELSNTVGRDLEEVHRAHRALAELHFKKIEDDINGFIDNTYRPEFIREFAKEFKLDERIRTIVAADPVKLLPVLTGFVERAVDRVEKKRAELLGPIQVQKTTIIEEIDAAHRQIQAAQAVVTGHLASVMKVREVQNDLLAKAGLGGVREKIAMTTAEISNRVGDFIKKGEEIKAKADSAEQKIVEINSAIDKLKAQIGRAGKDGGTP